MRSSGTPNGTNEEPNILHVDFLFVNHATTTTLIENPIRFRKRIHCFCNFLLSVNQSFVADLELTIYFLQQFGDLEIDGIDFRQNLFRI